ncbi:MAG: hypothetical protein AAB496_02480 [Patescibacteria group bacterium]
MNERQKWPWEGMHWEQVFDEEKVLLQIAEKNGFKQMEKSVHLVLELEKQKKYAEKIESGKRVYLNFLIEAGKERAIKILEEIENQNLAFWFAKYFYPESESLIKKHRLNEKDIERLMLIAINTKDPWTITDFTENFSFLMSKGIKGKTVNLIIESNCPGSACSIVKDFDLPIATLEKLAEIVINSKDPFWAYIFARDIKNVSLTIRERFSEIVINSRDYKMAYRFLKFTSIDPDFNKNVINNLKKMVNDANDSEWSLDSP